MPARVPVHWVEPPGVLDVLSSDEAVVALVAPHGGGKSAALAAWAADRSDVAWVEDGIVPERTDGYLIVDDAQTLDDAAWAELSRRLRRHPQLSIRMAAVHHRIVPDIWDAAHVTELYLGVTEIAAVLAALGSTAEPEVVWSVTHGHPASVRFIARSLVTSRRAMLDVLAFVDAPELAAGDAGLAVPVHLTTELVVELGSDPGVLHDAEIRGIGRWTGSPDARVFQLVPPVRSRVRAARDLDRDQRLTIRTIAAERLHQHGAHIEALTEAVAAQRLDLVEREIMSGGLTLLTLHARELEVQLHGIPTRALIEYPVLAAALSLVMHDQSSRRASAMDTARIAAAGLVGMPAAMLSTSRPGQRALLKALESMTMRAVGIGDEGVAAARQAAVLLDGLPITESADLGAMRGLARSNIALALMVTDHLEEARAQAVLGLDVPPGSGEALLALGVLALTDVLAGRIDDARASLARADQIRWPEPILRSHAGDMLRIARAWEALERGALADAEAILDELWLRIDTIEHWPLVTHVRAQVDIAAGRPTEGLERFHSVWRLRTEPVGSRPRSRRLLEITDCFLLMAARRPGATSAIRAPLDQPRLTLMAARAFVAAGEDRRALELVSSCVPVRPREVVASRALTAILRYRAGEEHEARAVAAEAVQVAAAHGLRTSLQLLPTDGNLFEGVIDVPVADLPRRLPALTERERVVLAELRRTASARQIAANLHVSINTIKSQLRSAYRKLDVSTRDEAIARAHVLGLYDDGDRSR